MFASYGFDYDYNPLLVCMVLYRYYKHGLHSLYSYTQEHGIVQVWVCFAVFISSLAITLYRDGYFCHLVSPFCSRLNSLKNC